MKATIGHTYAVVQDGKCHNTFTSEQLPEWADSSEQPNNPYTITAVDVTGAVPGIGDLWNGTAFTAPAAPPAPTTAQVIAALEQGVQNYIDSIAQKRGFDNINSTAKYLAITDAQIATLPTNQQPIVQKFRADAQTVALWASACWAFCYSSESAVSTGTIPTPTLAQLLAALPAAPW